MATFKHISSKNADYGAAEQYLTFEHDEFTMKPTLDENGRLMLREDYRIATLNCGDEDFAVACMRSNLRYGKNQKREDVKSHHYIISFDPRDAVDNGLTVDRAQALGEEFCRKQFPGHQAIVCTHPDGHNHSGNIHVHIVINSLRIEEVPFLCHFGACEIFDLRGKALNRAAQIAKAVGAFLPFAFLQIFLSVFKTVELVLLLCKLRLGSFLFGSKLVKGFRFCHCD